MGLTKTFLGWPVARQLLGAEQGPDVLARGAAARSKKQAATRPRTETADRVVKSVCPYCAVGCGQLVYVEDEKVTHIEGDPDCPHSRGRLCPKGSASEQLVNSPTRLSTVLYRAPYAEDFTEISLERATEMVVDRMIDSRARHWQEHDENGQHLRRTLGFAHLGGATLDNEENYLIKKLFTALGAIQVENQARI